MMSIVSWLERNPSTQIQQHLIFDRLGFTGHGQCPTLRVCVLVFAISPSQYEENRAASHTARWDILFNINSSLFLSIGVNNLSDALTEDSTGCSGLRYDADWPDSTEPKSGGAPISASLQPLIVILFHTEMTNVSQLFVPYLLCRD